MASTPGGSEVAAGLVVVDRREFRDGEHRFGSYQVHRSTERYQRAFMKLRRRDVPDDGRSKFSVVDGEGSCAVCVLGTAHPFAVEVRRGIWAEVNGEPWRISKRWFRPIEITGPSQTWTLGWRLGGWRLIAHGGERCLAVSRFGRTRVAAGLAAAEAALVVGLVETAIPEAASPVAWLRGL